MVVYCNGLLGKLHTERACSDFTHDIPACIWLKYCRCSVKQQTINQSNIFSYFFLDQLTYLILCKNKQTNKQNNPITTIPVIYLTQKNWWILPHIYIPLKIKKQNIPHMELMTWLWKIPIIVDWMLIIFMKRSRGKLPKLHFRLSLILYFLSDNLPVFLGLSWFLETSVSFVY